MLLLVRNLLPWPRMSVIPLDEAVAASEVRKENLLRLHICRRVVEAPCLTLHRQLLTKKDAVEQEMGESLIWDQNSAESDKAIALERHADIRGRSTWPELINWMADAVARMRSVFLDRVLALDLSPSEDD